MWEVVGGLIVHVCVVVVVVKVLSVVVVVEFGWSVSADGSPW